MSHCHNTFQHYTVWAHSVTLRHEIWRTVTIFLQTLHSVILKWGLWHTLTMLSSSLYCVSTQFDPNMRCTPHCVCDNILSNTILCERTVTLHCDTPLWHYTCCTTSVCGSASCLDFVNERIMWRYTLPRCQWPCLYINMRQCKYLPLNIRWKRDQGLTG